MSPAFRNIGINAARFSYITPDAQCFFRRFSSVMNFLNGIYSDDGYRFYTDPSPRFCVAAVAPVVEDAEKLAQVLQQVTPRLSVICADKVPATPEKRAAPSSDAFRLLRSDWCAERQKSVFCCVVLTCSLDHVGAAVTAAKIAEDLVSRVGTRVDLLRCDVVFAPTASSRAEGLEELTSGIEKALRSLLGTRLAGLALQTDVNGVWRGVAALQRLVLDSAVTHHKDEVQHLREGKDSIADDADQQRLLPRLFFEIGWHYLVLHDFSNARRQMLSGLRKLKSLFPLFPSFQARLCGSVFLWHFLFCVSVGGGHLTNGSEVYKEIRRFMDWIGLAYGGSVRDECQTVVSVLTKVLEAEWLEYLARKTENLEARECCDYLVAAAQALQDCVAFLPARNEGGSVRSPSHVGEEELLGDHASAVWQCFDKNSVRGRISRLLAEPKTLCSSRGTEVDFLAFLAGDDMIDGVPDTEAIDRIVASASGPIISRIAEVAWGAASSWSVLSPRLTAALLLHGCVDPLQSAEQSRYRARLSDLAGAFRNDVVLEYPTGALQAPFTAIAHFGAARVGLVGESATVMITLFTSSSDPIQVDVDALTVTIHAVPGATDTVVPIHPPLRVAVSGTKPEELSLAIPLSGSGTVACSGLSTHVRVGNASVAVHWRFAAVAGQGAGAAAQRSARGAFSALTACATLAVANPPTIFQVQCAAVLQAVEGECVECAVVVACASLGVRNGCMSIPHEPKLFSVVCGSSANEPLPFTEGDGQMRFALPDVAADASIRVVVSVACIRSAEFRLPVVVQYDTEQYGRLACTKTLHVSVDPPFNVEHTLLGGNQWSDTAGPLSVPSTNVSYTQYDKSVLVKAADITSSPLITNWKDDCALYFFAKETTARAFVFRLGDTVTLSCTFRCTAKQGVSIVLADVHAGDAVDLLSCDCGVAETFLEEGECATMVTRFRATRLGPLTPGFIRVFFAPQRRTMRLYSDVCMPPIHVEDAGVQVCASFPMLAPCGVPFALNVAVDNAAAAPFLGELVLDLVADDFACVATTRRTLQIGPMARDIARYVLTPLRVGEVRLPRFQVRCGATSRVVASGEDSHVVHVLPRSGGE